jgi:hypothetical protein
MPGAVAVLVSCHICMDVAVSISASDQLCGHSSRLQPGSLHSEAGAGKEPKHAGLQVGVEGWWCLAACCLGSQQLSMLWAQQLLS